MWEMLLKRTDSTNFHRDFSATPKDAVQNSTNSFKFPMWLMPNLVCDFSFSQLKQTVIIDKRDFQLQLALVNCNEDKKNDGL